MRTDSNIGASVGQANDVFEFPCSFAQQRFWLLEQVNAGSSLCNIPLRWRLTGKLDLKLMESAFQAVIERHESLRTWFRDNDGEPVQVVVPRADFKIAVVDLRRTPEDQRGVEVERLRDADANLPFDLTAPPLLRLTLLRLTETDHIAMVTVHHLICDGWSTGLLSQEFAHFYEALAGQQVAPLAGLPVQYPDYAVWERESFAADALASRFAYWKQKLSGLKYFELAPDFPQFPGRGTRGDYRTITLPASLTQSVKQLSRNHGVTMHTTALAALKTLLWRLSEGQSDITLGSQTAGRSQVELEGLIGVFVNTLVLRTQVEGHVPFSHLLARVNETLGDAISNQEAPFERLVAQLRPKRDASRTPFFSINLIYQRTFIQEREFAGIALSDMNFDTGGAIYDLNFYLVEHGEEWRFFCEFSPDRFKPETIERILQDFQATLRQAVENPELRVEEFKPADALISTGSTPSVASDLIAQLTDIWEEVLAVSPVDPDSDFFELGGHSLLATRLLARIDTRLGKRVKLATLFESPTIRQLAAAMNGSMHKIAVPGIVNIHSAGARMPIFCLHGVPSMALLARELGDDQPFYAVHLPEGSELKPPYTVEEIAAIHVKTIRRFQPDGPYLLVGWCREGLLAYEVAQQLRAQRQEVGMLVMFDTWKPDYPEYLTPRQMRAAERSLKYSQAWVRVKELGQMGAFTAAKHVSEMLGTALEDGWRHLRWKLKYRSELKSGNVEKPRTQDEMLFLAVDKYLARPYDSRALLFRSDKYKSWKYWNRILGWGSVLPQVELHEIPGVHDSMLTGPSLHEIAAAIAAAAAGHSSKLRQGKR
jgi:thioesterase domain-containing protein/aryl carrier-like protein